MYPVSLMQSQAGGAAGIIQSGLLAWYDSTNIDSYPGAGTDWFDLSGNNNHGRFQADPSINGNMFSINGDNVMLADWPYTNMSDITISFWWKHYDNKRNQYPLALSNSSLYSLFFDVNDLASGSLNRTMWVYWNSSGGNLAALATSGSNGVNSDFTDTTIRQYTFRRKLTDSQKCRHYVNGHEVTTGVQTLGDQAMAFFPNDSYQIRFGNHSNFFGKIGGLLIYNRALSNSEILSNYNVDAGKFN